MLMIIGTIPQEEDKVLEGVPRMKGDELKLEGRGIPINRGTPALIGAAIKVAEHLEKEYPYVLLAGDEGLGRGSRALYRILVERLPQYGADTLVFHYLLPDSDWHNKILFVIQGLKRRPKLIADAGYMYVAKMAGFATEYDLFTPDVGELAFLADEAAPHPFYTRGFLLYEDERVPELIQRAYAHQNASQCMLVKGRRDYVVKDGLILHVVEGPLVESLEAIGGTGDTITGMVSLFVDSGMDPVAASLLASKANRLAGLLSDPTPATQVVSIIERIPEALARLV